MPLSLTPARILLGAVFALTMHPLLAADFPVPAEGDWTLRDFHFRSGEVLPALTLHYRTVGAPGGIPVLLLHGTTQSGASLLAPQFGGALFGPGQPLDASRYFVILPDAIGHGKSSKPSDGLRAAFPRYSTEDMVDAQHQLVTEHLGIPHLRMVLGYSMGGMETWIYAQKYPAMMDIAVPMASLPTEMAGRNWILRRLISDSIRNDPAWMNGNYTTQPRSAQRSSVFFGLATNGGSQALQKAAPTRAKADALLDARLAAPFPADANDVLYQWESSRDYDPSAGLERITATLLAINSAELGIMESALRRVRNGRMLLVPASELTAGHGTAFRADLWKNTLAEVLKNTPQPVK